MKTLIISLMFLNLISLSHADDRSCKKECRHKYQLCLQDAFDEAEDGYIDVDGYVSGLSNKQISELYNSIEEQHKKLKASCRKDQDSCKETCNQD